MCDSCSQFSEDKKIRLPRELDDLIRRASKAVTGGTLEIIDGSLQWDDDIVCKMKCTTCGQQFELNCNTYHGRGGQWQRITH